MKLMYVMEVQPIIFSVIFLSSLMWFTQSGYGRTKRECLFTSIPHTVFICHLCNFFI